MEHKLWDMIMVLLWDVPSGEHGSDLSMHSSAYLWGSFRTGRNNSFWEGDLWKQEMSGQSVRLEVKH